MVEFWNVKNVRKWGLGESCIEYGSYYKINLPTRQTIEDRSYHPISLNEVSETKTIEEAAETYTEQQVFNLILLSSNMQFKSIQEVKIWITENNQQC